MNIFPKQIIPQKPVANLLKLMAYEASQKYDQYPKDNIVNVNKYSSRNTEIQKSEDNSEVLFLPGKSNIGCNEKEATSGKNKYAQNKTISPLKL